MVSAARPCQPRCAELCWGVSRVIENASSALTSVHPSSLPEPPNRVNLVGPQRDDASQFVGLGPVTLAPLNGNLQNSTILFDGKAVRPREVSWTPCEGTRSTGAGMDASDKLQVYNAVRMPFGKRQIWQRWNV